MVYRTVARRFAAYDPMQFGRKPTSFRNPRKVARQTFAPVLDPSMPKIEVQSGHLTALQRFVDLCTSTQDRKSLLNQYSERRTRLRTKKSQEQTEEAYRKAVEILMEPERWTFGHFANYQSKMVEIVGGGAAWRRALDRDNPILQQFEKELRVLDAMTPVELASNHKSVFTTDSKKLIAEKSEASVKFVDEVIRDHDILRADRRWYKIRKQFGKPLPKDFEDRSHMSRFDRPPSETEKEIMEEYSNKMGRDHVSHKKKTPRHGYIYYRQPSCGGNRWSTRPPRWYPVNWKMRPARRNRFQHIARQGQEPRNPYGRMANRRVSQ